MSTLLSLLTMALKTFIAGIPMFLVATFIVPRYLDYRRRPKLVITNRKTGDNVFYLEKTDSESKTSFEIGIQNNGITAQREWYWNLIIPEGVVSRLFDEKGLLPVPRSEILEDYSGKKWVRYMGKCGDAIYPHRNYLFPFKIELENKSEENSQDCRIYYFFGTEFGLSPSSVARLGDNLRLDKGDFTGCLGNIIVKFLKNN